MTTWIPQWGFNSPQCGKPRPVKAPMPTPKYKKCVLFKANFPNCKTVNCKNIRELQHCTGNEHTLDISTGTSGKDIKIWNEKYMSFEMNMLIMYHIHPLCTEKESKILQKCLKACLKIPTKLLLSSNYSISNISGRIIQLSAEAKNVVFTKWLTLKKRLCNSL